MVHDLLNPCNHITQFPKVMHTGFVFFFYHQHDKGDAYSGHVLTTFVNWQMNGWVRYTKLYPFNVYFVISRHIDDFTSHICIVDGPSIIKANGDPRREYTRLQLPRLVASRFTPNRPSQRHYKMCPSRSVPLPPRVSLAPCTVPF